MRSPLAYIAAIFLIALMCIFLPPLLTIDAPVLLLVIVLISALLWVLSRIGGRASMIFGLMALCFSAALVATILIEAMSILGPLGSLGVTFFLAAIFLVANWMKGERTRRARGLAGLCENCGYDLRESPDRCPECGSNLPEEITRRRRIYDELSKKPRDRVQSTSYIAELPPDWSQIE